jgi:hypothetical protein
MPDISWIAFRIAIWWLYADEIHPEAKPLQRNMDFDITKTTMTSLLIQISRPSSS